MLEMRFGSGVMGLPAGRQGQSRLIIPELNKHTGKGVRVRRLTDFRAMVVAAIAFSAIYYALVSVAELCKAAIELLKAIC
ncbi:MAG: hypothetical protein LiPW15_300 [Parcubacteria group bacterium LiPW_15]|nr:MAG: hypothetical protein LiPW15_300 [Parcubacteria group bacterium LiPW_15]